MAEPPVNLVMEMQSSGLNDAEVIRRLREQGYSEKDINDAFNQAKIKSTIKQEPFPTPATAEAGAGDYMKAGPPQQGGAEFVPAPSPEGYVQQEQPAPSFESYEYPQQVQQGYNQESYSTETFEEIAESIIEEKWRSFMDRIGDMQGWKETVDREIARIEKRTEKIDDAITGIHAALLEKVGEYGKNIKTLGSDVKAVEKALSQILSPLMRNVKDLRSVTETLKRRPHTNTKKKK